MGDQSHLFCHLSWHLETSWPVVTTVTVRHLLLRHVNIKWFIRGFFLIAALKQSDADEREQDEVLQTIFINVVY